MTTALARRVADRIGHAVHQWQFQLLGPIGTVDWLEEGRVDVQLAAMLITYAWRQGLSPSDFDDDNGLPALRALAQAIATDYTLRKTIKKDLIHAAYGGKSTLLTGEWNDVVEAATELLTKQPRRYEVEYKQR